MTVEQHLSVDAATPFDELPPLQPWTEPGPDFLRGLAFGVPLSALLWVGIFFAVRALW